MRRNVIVCLTLCLITLALYEPVRTYEFINFDDPLYVTESPRVLRGLSIENVVWVFGNVHANFWHPLTTLSLMANVEFFGPGPASFHITNVLLHGVNAVLLFLVIRQMTGALWQSAVVAALFAWHPLHVESVAWVSARKDVLSTLFWMLTLLAYVRYAARPRIGNYMLMLVLFSLGLMAKPMLVTLPFVLLLLDYWPLGRLSMGQIIAPSSPNTAYRTVAPARLIREKIPLFALAVIFSFLAYFAQGGAVAPLVTLPLWVRIANVPLAYVGYLKKTFWPVDLAPFYPYPTTVPLPNVLAAIFLIIIITWAVLRFAKNYPFLPVGWLWYLGTLVPVIGIIQLGQYRTADRFTYVPLIGIFIMVVWGVAETAAKFRFWKSACATAACGGLIACLALSRMQISHWKDSISLLTHTLSVTSRNSMAHTNLGVALAAQRKADEAEEHFRKAIQIKSNNAHAHSNLAGLLFHRKRIDEAMWHYKEALAIQPDLTPAHLGIGAAFASQGKTDEALAHFEVAVHLNPDSAESHNNLAVALATKGRTSEAIEHFREALRANPNHAGARKNLREVLAHQKASSP